MANSTQVVGTSTQQVLTSLVSNGVIFGAFMLGFILLRIKLKRIYEPKSSFDLINDEKKPEPLPNGLWQWLIPLLKKSDNFVIQQAGLDGYFFLRYLLLIASYCTVSMLYIFPVLLPVNAANGAGESGLNILAYQNVRDSNRYYAHIFCGWLFFWLYMYITYRELYYYNSLKQNVLSSPRYAHRLSSRTVLFQTVPKQYLSEVEFSKLFDGVKRVWIARSSKDVSRKVEERDNLTFQLENAETNYIKQAVKKVAKIRKKSPDHTPTDNIEEYVPDNKRPKHRTRFLIGKKVDSIDYYKEKLLELNKEIEELQNNHMDAPPFNSVFVEFESPYQAQVAAQVVAYHSPLYLTPAYIGIEPKDIVWFNLRMSPYERLLRRLGSSTFIIALVILWAIPVAFVGLISNITYLTNKLHWLRFIYKLPDVLLGLLTSLAPTVALALLMMVLPRIIRAMAVIEGSPSAQYIEYYTQQAYFAFQVIQVFLVTTVTSAATSTVTQIVENPTSAMTMLAANLPKASNFYVAYIVLQGMSVSSGGLLQIVDLVLFYLLGTFLDGTARKKWTRFTNLSSYQWGTTFPVYTNLAVIVFSYSIISPIILLFGAVGFFLLYVAYLYNLTYVCKESPDSRGVHYPRALFQTIVGVYIGQICLLGLFVVGKGWGPIVLQAVGLVVTVLLHLYLNEAFDHLMKYSPVDTMKPLDGKSNTPSFKNIYRDPTDTLHWDGIKELPQFPIRKYHNRSNSQILHESLDLKSSSIITANTHEYRPETSPFTNSAQEENNNIICTIPLLADKDTATIPYKPFWKRFFLPHIYCSYKAVKTRLPEIYAFRDPDEMTSEADIEHAYDYPAVSKKCPYLWIPEDPYGFSKHRINDLSGVVDVTDRGNKIDAEGKITWSLKPPSHDEADPFSDVKSTEEYTDGDKYP